MRMCLRQHDTTPKPGSYTPDMRIRPSLTLCKGEWVDGLIQTLLVRLPLAYYMSVQPDASLTKIGLAAPVATAFGIIINVIYYMVMNRKARRLSGTAEAKRRAL